jgi:septal ring factor EnvC (AmiA/AmiB activator)
MQRYAEVRKQQAASIEETQVEIKVHLAALQQDKVVKETYANQQEKEKSQIASDKKKQQNKLAALQSEEQKLREQQKKQEGDRKKLTNKIEEIIRKEIEAAEKAARANTSAATPGASASSKTLELAPEVKLMNSDFEKNKGGLPWPVASGVITSGFGRQAHPTIPGIEINNNGLDFITEKNAEVKAVFGGLVSSVFSIPGAGFNVIITHGSYKTVYSGLNTTSVKAGDTVIARQGLGTVLYDGESNILHFELWKVNAQGGVPQNPGLWIKKR